MAMNNPTSNLVLKNVIFRGNSAALDGNPVGFAINSQGGLEMLDVCFLNNVWSVAPVISVGASTTASNVYSTPQEEGLLCDFAAEVNAEANLVCTIEYDSDYCTVIGVTESPSMSPSIAASSETPTVEPSSKAPVAAVVDPAPTPTPAPPAADSAYGPSMTLLLASVISVGLLVV
eukprot:CAMPEP_0113604186 /NCGR_PEP_ID=MMETSP0017_2-20120614/1666_1 /TAXON_ID=2856 /ORGANISM="Cylindrotheca closterium" /LENGTH=174 /DNA_ID=CAMNT_0000512605 /DNA_START=200 /DNA_END=724 /DNA_ORIENTATION=- /assembly_acc=CAM_ASM_000147